MKTILVALAAAALIGGGVIPAFRQEVVSAKRASPELKRRWRANDLRIESALGALKRNDHAHLIEVRGVITGLEPNDRHRPAFAAALAARGEVRAAYELERTRAHFAEYSLPNDPEMAFYADLAERTGHSDEAAWARDRVGEDGHFRVWRRGEEYIFARGPSHWPMGSDEYAATVKRHMESGIELYPRFQGEIETLRRELLGKPERP